MIYRDVKSDSRPDQIVIEQMTDGRRLCWLADGIREESSEEGTCYIYNLASFVLDADRTDTANDIMEEWESWWAYAELPEAAMPTLEERVEDLELMMLELLS